MKAKKEDYVGKKINKLTITDLYIDKVGKKGNTATYATCLCDCGKTTSTTLNAVKRGHTKSCGCVGISTRFEKNSTKREILNFFEEITPETCYWAGFIFGDGSISKDGGLQVGLSMHTPHTQDHLKKMSIFFYGQDYRLFYKDLCILQVRHTDIAKNLQQFGIIPNKTYDGHLILPTQYQSDFIRGYFDADGWFTIRQQYNKQFKKYYDSQNWGLCSYLRKNLEIVQETLPVESYIIKKKTQTLYELRVYKRDDLCHLINYLNPIDKNLCYFRKWEKLWNFQQKYQNI